MTYDVLKDFTDEEFKVPSGDEEKGKIPLSKAAGEKFIPAEVHYPQNKVDALVLDGTLKLVTPVAPHGDKHAAKKK